MNNLHHLSQNQTLSSTELMSTISGNIAGMGLDGHRAKRWGFKDFMHGGEVVQEGFSMKQGKQEPRIGEWTKLYIKGKGFFTVRDPNKAKTMYTRLGDFHIDGSGDMVTKEGFLLMGTPLEGSYTRLRREHRFSHYNTDPTNMTDFATENVFRYNSNGAAQQLNPPGRPIGNTQTINVGLDPRNGKYLGLYDEIKVAEDGIVYGKDGNNLVSLYKIQLANFNNAEGLTDLKDGVYFEPNDRSGLPTLASTNSTIISEAIEKSNVFSKVEAHYLTEAQRYFQFSTQAQKLADKITGTAIELIQ
ncbi:MAG: flagellar hook basal-body protein [Candidatus Caenarcaniphilales bacterium]|nr:flagellar hook basal-body protein [Candidatus Caenarcaniphilales bacterium]